MKKTVNGVELYYEIEGEGPWMTLSHSLACDSSMWEPQVKPLSAHYKVLRFDSSLIANAKLRHLYLKNTGRWLSGCLVRRRCRLRLPRGPMR